MNYLQVCNERSVLLLFCLFYIFQQYFDADFVVKMKKHPKDTFEVTET